MISLQRTTISPLVVVFGALLLALAIWAGPAFAHGVEAGDKGYIQETSGIVFWPFVYLGAKHMVTGYDHLLFLFGVIFFLYKMKDIGIYVTMFAVGHSVTLPECRLDLVFGRVAVETRLPFALGTTSGRLRARVSWGLRKVESSGRG